MEPSQLFPDTPAAGRPGHLGWRVRAGMRDLWRPVVAHPVHSKGAVFFHDERTGITWQRRRGAGRSDGHSFSSGDEEQPLCPNRTPSPTGEEAKAPPALAAATFQMDSGCSSEDEDPPPRSSRTSPIAEEAKLPPAPSNATSRFVTPRARQGLDHAARTSSPSFETRALQWEERYSKQFMLSDAVERAKAVLHSGRSSRRVRLATILVLRPNAAFRCHIVLLDSGADSDLLHPSVATV